jgi:hypothetical protein
MRTFFIDDLIQLHCLRHVWFGRCQVVFEYQQKPDNDQTAYRNA